MRIIVCAKHVMDSTEIRFDEAAQKLILSNLPTKISDYDRSALEAAAVLRESGEDVSVEVLMVGDQTAQKTLKEAIAMGADSGYLIEGGWENPFDPILSARVLCRAIEEIGIPDLILCGLVSEDGYSGLTGPALAELLEVPYLAPVTTLSLTEEAVEAVLDQGDTLQTVRSPFPCVLGIDSSMNVPRLPTVLQVMKVKNDRLRRFSLEDLGLSAAALANGAATVALEGYSSGAVKRKGAVLEGAVEEAVSALLQSLAEDGVLS